MNSLVPSSGSISQKSRPPVPDVRCVLSRRLFRQHGDVRGELAQPGAQDVVRGAVRARDRRIVGLVFDVVAGRVDLEDRGAGGVDEPQHFGQQRREVAGYGSVQAHLPVMDGRIIPAPPTPPASSRHARAACPPFRSPTGPASTSCASTWTAPCSTCISTTCSGSRCCRGAGARRAASITTAAMAQLRPRFDARRGTLDWYCVDHWSDELGLDIAGAQARTARRDPLPARAPRTSSTCCGASASACCSRPTPIRSACR